LTKLEKFLPIFCTTHQQNVMTNFANAETTMKKGNGTKTESGSTEMHTFLLTVLLGWDGFTTKLVHTFVA